MIVRARTENDLVLCELLAHVVHLHGDYPARFPADLRRFLATPGAIASWVAEADGAIVGHVALHQRSSNQVMALAAEATRRTVDSLAVVARLLVSPAARRRGVGRSLLAAASGEALDRGLSPVLDVATHYDAAIKLYESCGWTRVGRVTVRFRDADPLEEWVYVGP